MPNIHDTLQQLALEAGGPGSGRHSSGKFNFPNSYSAHAHMSKKGFKQDGKPFNNSQKYNDVTTTNYKHPDTGQTARVKETGYNTIGGEGKTHIVFDK